MMPLARHGACDFTPMILVRPPTHLVFTIPASQPSKQRFPKDEPFPQGLTVNLCWIREWIPQLDSKIVLFQILLCRKTWHVGLKRNQSPHHSHPQWMGESWLSHQIFLPLWTVTNHTLRSGGTFPPFTPLEREEPSQIEYGEEGTPSTLLGRQFIKQGVIIHTTFSNSQFLLPSQNRVLANPQNLAFSNFWSFASFRIKIFLILKRKKSFQKKNQLLF